MRGTGIIAGAFLAWALGLIDGEAIARVQSPHVATSMASGADAGQVQSVILEWLRVTVKSTEFHFGIAAGVLLAAIGSFIWRWICKAFGGATIAAKFIMHHRLVAVAAAGIGYYVFARFVMA
jgi:hypothetical protein